VCVGEISGLCERHGTPLQDGALPNQLLLCSSKHKVDRKNVSRSKVTYEDAPLRHDCSCFRELFHWLRSEAAIPRHQVPTKGMLPDAGGGQSPASCVANSGSRSGHGVTPVNQAVVASFESAMILVARNQQESVVVAATIHS
jgi:hypothetical protein